MRLKHNTDATAAFLVLLFTLLLVHALKGALGCGRPCEPSANKGRVFVQIGGEVRHPGIYAFCAPPHLNHLLEQAGGLRHERAVPPVNNRAPYGCGETARVRISGERVSVHKGRMSAFHRLTLGIPLSLNRETPQGLTALPGVGPKIAEAIVRERGRRGGFRQVREILSVPGIGPKLYGKIRPHLVL